MKFHNKPAFGLWMVGNIRLPPGEVICAVKNGTGALGEHRIMADFVHEIDVAADTEAVRELISRHGDSWWTTNAIIDDREGGTCEFRFPSAGFFATIQVLKNAPDLIEWRCIDSSLSPASLKASGGTDAREWVGTTIRFVLTALGPASTRVRLEHLGLGASAEFYSSQNNVWAFYLESLKQLAETGKGNPFQGGPPHSSTIS